MTAAIDALTATPVARSVEESPASPPTSSAAPVLDWEAWEGKLGELARAFQIASPYPHSILHPFLDPECASRAAREFPRADESWIQWTHYNERKFGNSDASTFGPALAEVTAQLSSPRFLRFLEGLTGLRGLRADPDLNGGGLHQTPQGGFLNVHTDYSIHPYHPTWQRRINLLLFLNEDWPDSYGGHLELWSQDMKRCVERIAPRVNTCVIFITDGRTFHGHPDPLTCPPDRSRNSLALYYFTEDPGRHEIRDGLYQHRPGDGLKAVAIHGENVALRLFAWLRRNGVLSEAAASRVLGLATALRRKRN